MDTELADYLESCGAVGGIIKESYTAKFYKNKCEELVLENKKLSKSMHDLTMSFSHTTSDAETSLIKLTQKNKELKEEIEEYIQTEKVDVENDEKMKTELVMMYSIIMNDGVKSEIPFLNCADTITILKSNITLMLEKFKELQEDSKKLNNIVDDFCDFWNEEEVKHLGTGRTTDEEKDFIVYNGVEHTLISDTYRGVIRQLQDWYKEKDEEVDKLEEQEEFKSIGKDEEIANYQDIIEDLENTNKELQEEIKTSNDINIKLKDEIECMKSHSDMSEGEYEGELKDKETIVNYLKDELDKYKKLFDESKKENEKAKDIKGVVVNEDKTIITINGIELKIGDKFTTDNTEYILKEIYIGKSGKYSLRTDKITIRIGTKYIIGKEKITKE